MNTITVDAVLAVLPRRLVRAFSYAPKADHVRLEHETLCGQYQCREEMYDARKAIEAAGYRVADSASSRSSFFPRPKSTANPRASTARVSAVAALRPRRSVDATTTSDGARCARGQG